jgi:hypothetical protein
VTRPPAPILVPNHGGPTITAPAVWFLSSPTDPDRDKVKSMIAWYVTSELAAQAGEYGISAGTLAGASDLPDLPQSATQDDLEKALAGAIDAGRLPAPDAQRIYFLLLPAGVSLIKRTGEKGCVDFHGFHHTTEDRKLVYAVDMSCPVGAGGRELPTGDEATEVASHEILEAATDPDGTAWNKHELPGEGELADLCNKLGAEGGGFVFQRSYSDRAAQAGQDPCMPSNPGEPYFGLGPVSEDALVGQAGSPLTLDAIAFASAPLAARDAGPLHVYSHVDSGVTVTLSTEHAKPGEHVKVTVTVLPGTPPGDDYGFELLAEAHPFTDFTRFPVQVIVK